MIDYSQFPMGSSDPRVAKVNKENFDLFSVSMELTYPDRFGVQRMTMHGMELAVQGLVLASPINDGLMSSSDKVKVDALSLGAIPKVINFTSATGSVNIADTLPVMAIGDRVLVRKLNATQGTVTITFTGHTFTRAALASVSLNSDGDFWLIEKVTATRLDLADGCNTGSNANGEWIRSADGAQRCLRIFLSVPSPGTNTTLLTAWTFPVEFSSSPVMNIAPLSPNPDSYSPATASSVSATSGTVCTRRNTTNAHDFNALAIGRWYS